MIIPLMAADLFGVRALGRTMGIILVADGVAESLFPMLVGALYNDAAKSYAVGFIMLICLALTGAMIVAFLPKTSVYQEIPDRVSLPKLFSNPKSHQHIQQSLL